MGNSLTDRGLGIFGSDPVYALGFYPWKRRLLRAFFPGVSFRFVRTAAAVPAEPGVQVATWGADIPRSAFPDGCRLWRCEDGFIRSVGLGAKFAPASSWVIDGQGMYFDAREPSDLECLIAERHFTAVELARAAALRGEVVRLGLTKYNLRGGAWTRPADAERVILVAGQVQSDASIRHATQGIRTNLALLTEVRKGNPKAHVIYKPHPDVVAGVRRAGHGEESAASWCDEVLPEAPMAELLNAVDEVHVLTSLTGFEGLLRGKKVVTYGQPFYAGWGLTEDRYPVGRRTRQVGIDHLVAAALIEYPMYLHPREEQRCEPEDFVREIAAGRARPRQSLLERLLGRLSDSPLWTRWIAK